MKFIRKLLYKILGLKGFVRLVSRIYLCLVRNGFLKSKYPELFYLEKIIKPGFTCIDIGANVGYYSVMLSKHVGKEGKVLAVEPIPVFADIWQKNVKLSRISNLILFPYALGSEEKIVQMGVPKRDGVVHHGMTKITETQNEKYVAFFDVEMKNPGKLFAGLEKVDFIKCDVEGYESIVFSNMKEIIIKHRPLVQSELSGEENRSKVISTFEELEYKVCVLENNQLIDVPVEKQASISSDFYFVPVDA